jgi:hypothetical protein
MAHELASAGYGYLWPRMLFVCDGEEMQIWATQSLSRSKRTVRYLTDAYHDVSVASFERTVDEFVDGVVARLNALNVTNTVLQELWPEVLDERRDKALSAYRRFEAMLGFDPDECPQALLDRVKSLVEAVGEAATSEIAPLCATENPEADLEKIVDFSERRGVTGRITLSLAANDATRNEPLHAWERGRRLARRVRDAVGLNGSAVNNKLLCDLVGLPEGAAFAAPCNASGPKLGVAVREKGSSEVKFLFRRRNRPGRRFELARFLCDHLIASESDGWLPITDAKTVRQKIQRSFAAELLCPIRSLSEMLSGDFSSAAIEDAADHFGVSEKAVETQLVNNHYLPPDVLNEYPSGFDFPYVASRIS